jgi:arginase
VGLHSWTDGDYPHLAEWGLQSFGPDELRESSAPVLDWLAGTGCSRAAIHFDVDTVDSNEIVLGLGAEPGGLTSAQVRRIVAECRPGRRCRRIYDRGVHSATGHAPAANPQGFSAH